MENDFSLAFGLLLRSRDLGQRTVCGYAVAFSSAVKKDTERGSHSINLREMMAHLHLKLHD